MYLTHLSLTNFRLFSRLDMDVPRRILLLVGDNAQGKTSILEAIYFLATFTTFQAQSDRQLVSFLVENDSLSVARLVADYRRGEQQHRLEVRLIRENTNGGVRARKEILLDGVRRTVHHALGHFNAVLFLPQMTRILEGSPEERRRYLNLAISQAIPGYAQALSDYVQTLSQRNALLKQLAERSGDTEQLRYWDELLADRGATLIHARIAAVANLEKLASRFHQQLTHSQEVLRLHYYPAYDPASGTDTQFRLPIEADADRSGFSREKIAAGFYERLQALHREEIQRGVTTIGPHRDELRMSCNGIDVIDFGSRGQVRTVLLGLKLAEVAWLKEKTGHYPVLLLDEMMAELDLQRRADVLESLGDCEQAFLTTTDLSLYSPDFTKTATIWRVEGGEVAVDPDAAGWQQS